MAAEAAALLDELMGRNRNANPHEKSGTIKWDHAEVCKHFLCGYCPNELFVNTKADLGPCNLIHDEPLKREYQSSSRFEKMGYEEKWIEELESIVNDVDKKIKRGHQRLAMTQNSDSSPSHGTPGPRQEQIMQLTEKIDDLVEKAEKLGNEGKVEEAQGVMKLCDQLKKERQQFENLSNDHLNNPHLAKQMEVCPICGAFLIVGDAESRQREHLMGKQHMGYAQMRATVEQFKEQKRQKIAAHKAEMEKKREEERKKLEERERSRRRSRSRDRKDRRRSSPGRRRSRSRERRRSKSRERRRSRSKDRHRSRSRDRGARDRTNGRRSRSRDRRQSDRGGRETRRDSSRGRRDRSRERDSEKTSKSNDSDRNKRKDGSRSRSRDRSKEKSDAKETYDTKEQKVTNGDKYQSNDDKNMDEDMQDSGQHSNDEGTRDSNTTYNSM